MQVRGLSGDSWEDYFSYSKALPQLECYRYDAANETLRHGEMRDVIREILKGGEIFEAHFNKDRKFKKEHNLGLPFELKIKNKPNEIEKFVRSLKPDELKNLLALYTKSIKAMGDVTLD